MLEQLDKRIIAAMQDDLPVTEWPFGEVAARIGISETELLARLNEYRRQGRIRKMGAVLRHREVGYTANALCAFCVNASELEQAGMKLAASPLVTHCYAREAHPDWPYNLYIMLHARTRDECREQAAKLAAEAGLTDYIMLFSTKEWKKSNVRYFQEVGEK